MQFDMLERFVWVVLSHRALLLSRLRRLQHHCSAQRFRRRWRGPGARRRWSHDQFASLQLPLTRQPSPALMVLATDLVLIRPVWYESHAEPMAFGGRSRSESPRDTRSDYQTIAHRQAK